MSAWEFTPAVFKIVVKINIAGKSKKWEPRGFQKHILIAS